MNRITRLWMLAAALWAAWTFWVPVARAADFTIQPVRLPGGTTIFGSVSTDGTLGPLSAEHLTGWQVTVRHSTRYRFDPTQAGGVQALGVAVSADGRRLSVRTSPDGVRDGGLLAFGSFGPGPEYGVQVANFTGPYAAGGVAFYLAGAAFEWQWLQAPDGSRRVVAQSAAAAPGQFRLVPVVFPGGARLSGSITTDGSTGPIGPAQILSWDLQVDTADDTLYYRDATGSNSVVLPASQGFSTDGVVLSVARPGGYLGFGVPPAPPRRGAGAVLADFTAEAPAQGQAGWFDPFGLQWKPLHFSGSLYPVASTQP